MLIFYYVVIWVWKYSKVKNRHFYIIYLKLNNIYNVNFIIIVYSKQYKNTYLGDVEGKKGWPRSDIKPFMSFAVCNFGALKRQDITEVNSWNFILDQRHPSEQIFRHFSLSWLKWTGFKHKNIQNYTNIDFVFKNMQQERESWVRKMCAKTRLRIIFNDNAYVDNSK